MTFGEIEYIEIYHYMGFLLVYAGFGIAFGIVLRAISKFLFNFFS